MFDKDEIYGKIEMLQGTSIREEIVSLIQTGFSVEYIVKNKIRSALIEEQLNVFAAWAIEILNTSRTPEEFDDKLLDWFNKQARESVFLNKIWQHNSTSEYDSVIGRAHMQALCKLERWMRETMNLIDR